MKTQIINAKVILDDQILYNGVVAFNNGFITYVGNEEQQVDKTIDAKGNFLFAGFIDIHCHGGNGLDFMDATQSEMTEISKFHLKHGTTTLYATTLTDTMENIENALKVYATIENPLTLAGVHLEGPWFSPLQCGAQDTSTMSLPTVKKFEELMRKYPFIKRVSIAPELDGALEVGKCGKSWGISMSIGHTDADFDTVVKASNSGFNLMTHFYSGMRGVVRKNAYREAGAIEGGYYCDNLAVEIIADGKHLPHSLLKLIYKIKGADKICLITDGTRGSGLNDGETFMLGKLDGGTLSIIEDGVAKLPDRTSFAGSVATTDRLVRTMHDLAKVNLCEISKMASKTPAKVMGLTDRGYIAVGMRADFVFMDENLNVQKVIFKGEEVE